MQGKERVSLDFSRTRKAANGMWPNGEAAVLSLSFVLYSSSSLEQAAQRICATNFTVSVCCIQHINVTMPKGLPPDITSMVQRIGPRLNQIISEAIVYFGIPSSSELRTSWIQAISDSMIALHSIRKLLILSFRPLYILLSWISFYLWMLLKVLFQHSLHHGMQACKQGGKEAYYYGQQLLQYQKSLSREAVYIELTILTVLVSLYAIRRYIQKKRYVERLLKWYTLKRNLIQKRYKNLVDKVAETSMLVALLLPHVLYIMGFGIIRYFLPSSVAYVATQTIFTSVISYGIPFIQTIALIARWQHHEHNVLAVIDSSKTAKSSPDSKKDKKLKGPMKGDETTTETLCNDISHRLMYWIVCSILASSFQIMRLLPILSGFFPNRPDVASSTNPTISRWSLRGNGVNSLARFQLSHRTCEEMRLFFFLWLHLLSRGDHGSSMEEKPKSKRSLNTWSALDQSSLCLVYDRIKPFLRSVTNNMNKISSVIPSSEHDSSDDRMSLSIIHRIIHFAASFLDFLVWTKVLSKKNKNAIINSLVESIGLFPALPSLFMPSYFTKFGVIYVSSIVPAANSAYAHEVLRKRVESAPMSVRFLEYWVLHTIVSSIISYLTPIISWFPLSTHAQLLLWLLLQIEFILRTLYRCFTEELIFFGVLKSPVECHQSSSVIMRWVAYVSKRLKAKQEENRSAEVADLVNTKS